MDPLGEGDPRWVGRYRVQARLGSGGMGRVYLAFSPGGRAVAVKVIHPELARDPAFLARFRQEVAAARKVSGVYTAPVIDASGGDEDPPWLATAFVPGPSLADAVAERGPLPPESLWRLAAGLAEALTVIHGHGLVHRDLKPTNVLLAADGPRVIDFGISRALDATTTTAGATATGMIVGTPSFMSPEQAEGRPAGPPSDVFSLGCVLAYAATGAGPFGGGPPASIMYRVVHSEPTLDGIDGPLRDLIARCLAKDPAGRPTLAALMDVITAQPASATPALSFWPPDLAGAIAAYQAQLTGTASAVAPAEPGVTPSAPAREPTQRAAIQPARPGPEQTATARHSSEVPPPPPLPAETAAGPGRSPRRSRLGAALAAGAGVLAIAAVIVTIVALGAKGPKPAPAAAGHTGPAAAAPASKVSTKASRAPATAGSSAPSRPPARPRVLMTLSGTGALNSAPFLVTSSVVTAHYSYNCAAFGTEGNFIADMISGTPTGAYDDQPIANALGSRGSQTTALYPAKAGSRYHLAINSECSWRITLTAEPPVASPQPAGSRALIALSGTGALNSLPFRVTSSVVTAHYSYSCAGNGSQGNFIADMISGIPTGAYDDQPIANALGSGGSQTTTLYPARKGSLYHLAINSECSWHITLTAG
jgi:Protein kinase domain